MEQLLSIYNGISHHYLELHGKVTTVQNPNVYQSRSGLRVYVNA